MGEQALHCPGWPLRPSLQLHSAHRSAHVRKLRGLMARDATHRPECSQRARALAWHSRLRPTPLVCRSSRRLQASPSRCPRRCERKGVRREWGGERQWGEWAQARRPVSIRGLLSRGRKRNHNTAAGAGCTSAARRAASPRARRRADSADSAEPLCGRNLSLQPHSARTLDTWTEWSGAVRRYWPCPVRMRKGSPRQ